MKPTSKLLCLALFIALTALSCSSKNTPDVIYTNGHIYTSDISNSKVISKKHDGAGKYSYLGVSDGYLYAAIADAASVNITWGSQVTTDTWHHIAATFNDVSNITKLYLDGVNVNT